MPGRRILRGTAGWAGQAEGQAQDIGSGDRDRKTGKGRVEIVALVLHGELSQPNWNKWFVSDAGPPRFSPTSINWRGDSLKRALIINNGDDDAANVRTLDLDSRLQPDASIDLLEAALRNRGKDASAIGLPYPSYGDAGLNFSTRPQFLEGEGWRGLRWIASYGQDIGCWFDDSAYVFEGISNDGQLFMLMRATVFNPKVATRLAQDCKAAVEETPRREMDQMFKKDVPAMFDKAMSAADPASFQPNLDQLDAVVRSLKLQH